MSSYYCLLALCHGNSLQYNPQLHTEQYRHPHIILSSLARIFCWRGLPQCLARQQQTTLPRSRIYLKSTVFRACKIQHKPEEDVLYNDMMRDLLRLCVLPPLLGTPAATTGGGWEASGSSRRRKDRSRAGLAGDVRKRAPVGHAPSGAQEERRSRGFE